MDRKKKTLIEVKLESSKYVLFSQMFLKNFTLILINNHFGMILLQSEFTVHIIRTKLKAAII